MATKYHAGEQKIPAGFRIFEDLTEVDDIWDYRKNAVAFILSPKDKWLELRQEPHSYTNIAVLGCWKGFFGTKRRQIGWVPGGLASKLLDDGWLNKVKTRLYKTVITENEWVSVGFHILGPESQFSEWKPAPTKIDWLGSVDWKGKIEYERGPYNIYEEVVKTLKSEKRYEEAIELSHRLIEEAEKQLPPIDSWPYYHLATIYRKQKRYKEEVELLEQYEKTKRAKDAKNPLGERLEKARILLQKNSTT